MTHSEETINPEAYNDWENFYNELKEDTTNPFNEMYVVIGTQLIKSEEFKTINTVDIKQIVEFNKESVQSVQFGQNKFLYIVDIPRDALLVTVFLGLEDIKDKGMVFVKFDSDVFFIGIYDEKSKSTAHSYLYKNIATLN